jgi:hypothetical protein
MKPFLSISLVLFFLFSTSCSTRGKDEPLSPDAPPDSVPDIATSYVVNGFDPAGIEYSGLLTITPTEIPGTYHLQWIITGGIQQGSGVLTGNTLLVDWQSDQNFSVQSHGTAKYIVTKQGELHGTRSVEGMSGEGTETAFPNNNLK